MLWFERVYRLWHARFDVTEGTCPRANVAQYHHRRVLLGPAFADIRTRRLFTHCIEIEVAHQPAGLIETRTTRRFYANPVRLALTGRALGRCHGRVHLTQIAMQPPLANCNLPAIDLHITEEARQ